MLILNRLPTELCPRLGGVRLCMIVKNEALNIERCLSSVKHLINSWCIVDTGSIDNTPDLIQRCLGDLPGKLFHEPWVDFGYNRTEAFYLSRQLGTTDYIILIDADEICTLSQLPQHPCYDVYLGRFTYNEEKFLRPLLIKADKPFWWRGRIHEELCCEEQVTTKILENAATSYPTGGRHTPGWLERDIALIKEDLDANPHNIHQLLHLERMLKLQGDCNGHVSP